MTQFMLLERDTHFDEEDMICCKNIERILTIMPIGQQRDSYIKRVQLKNPIVEPMAAAQAPLRPWNPNLQHTDRERWICIYPAYLNKKKTRQEGRRIPKESCVDNPSFQEIRDVLHVLNLNVIVENKQYSREKSKELAYRGRIRVQLKNVDGSPILKEYPTRDSLLLYLGKTIPQLKTRQSKPNESASQQHASSSGSGGQSHKKGKGKRR